MLFGNSFSNVRLTKDFSLAGDYPIDKPLATAMIPLDDVLGIVDDQFVWGKKGFSSQCDPKTIILREDGKLCAKIQASSSDELIEVSVDLTNHIRVEGRTFQVFGTTSDVSKKIPEIQPGDNLFQIIHIEAKSDVPLYLNSQPKRGEISSIKEGLGMKKLTAFPHHKWQTVWSPDASLEIPVAFILPDSGNEVLANIRLQVHFEDSVIGKTAHVVGMLNGKDVLKSPSITASGDFVDGFTFVTAPSGIPNGPLAFNGSFVWEIRFDDGGKSQFPLTSPLEIYLVGAPSKIWQSYGVNVNLLRAHVSQFSEEKLGWSVSEYYHDSIQSIFDTAFRYDNINGGFRYVGSYLGTSYDIDKYCQDLESRKEFRVNCYDVAGIVQVVLNLYPALEDKAVQWYYLYPYGFIKEAILKGWILGNCNNPYWGDLSGEKCYEKLIGNSKDTGKPNSDRSAFKNHAFISAQTGKDSDRFILDACCGPHYGNETFDAYIDNAIDTKTDYEPRHKVYDGFMTRPGISNDLNSSRKGVTSIGVADIGKPPANVASVIDAFAQALGNDHPAVLRIPEFQEGQRFTRLNLNELRKTLVEALGMECYDQETHAGEHNSSFVMYFTNEEFQVEAQIDVTVSKAAALLLMTQYVSASHTSAGKQTFSPLDSRCGEYSLVHSSKSCLLFIRDNVAVRINGLSKSKDLVPAAEAVDALLQKDSSDSPHTTSIPKHLDSIVASTGESFEITVQLIEGLEVKSVKARTSDVSIVQFLEVAFDGDNVRFKFQAGMKGKCDVALIFAHIETGYSATSQVKVDVN